jgi:hypothetical protein
VVEPRARPILEPVALLLAKLVRGYLSDDRLPEPVRGAIRVYTWVKHAELVPPDPDWISIDDLIRVRVVVECPDDVDVVTGWLLQYFRHIGLRDECDGHGSDTKSFVIALPRDVIPRDVLRADAPRAVTIDVTTDRNPLANATPVFAGERG